MNKFLRNNGLSLALFALFAVTLLGQSLAGFHVYNDARRSHGEATASYLQYLRSGDFLEVTMENWESEFFQMFVYVVFTVFLFQKGSSESKSPDGEPEDVDRDPRRAHHEPNVPSPVRKGGWRLAIYEHSLSLAFLLLFCTSFLLHAAGGVRVFNHELLQHGEPPISFAAYLVTSQFWFESLQNWQSEFMAIGTIVVLSVFLRQRGSPESKPVDTPHSQNW
ncbi:MAG TPA: DUF6766 family protein [Povalibacter sp.]|nr:DUF6766 family protein [Povalibacter sp.]